MGLQRYRDQKIWVCGKYSFPFTLNILNPTYNYNIKILRLGCLAGGFSFKLWDGKNIGEKEEFQVLIEQLVLKEKINKELHVFPGSQTKITESDLYVQTSDTHSQARKYSNQFFKFEFNRTC